MQMELSSFLSPFNALKMFFSSWYTAWVIILSSSRVTLRMFWVVLISIMECTLVSVFPIDLAFLVERKLCMLILMRLE